MDICKRVHDSESMGVSISEELKGYRKQKGGNDMIILKLKIKLLLKYKILGFEKQ